MTTSQSNNKKMSSISLVSKQWISHISVFIIGACIADVRRRNDYQNGYIRGHRDGYRKYERSTPAQRAIFYNEDPDWMNF